MNFAYHLVLWRGEAWQVQEGEAQGDEVDEQWQRKVAQALEVHISEFNDYR